MTFLAVSIGIVVALVALERATRPKPPADPHDDNWHTRRPS